MSFDLKPGQQLVWITCGRHKRPSKVGVFVRDLREGSTYREWHEFPAFFPPSTQMVDDEARLARPQFDPEVWDLEQRRTRYAFRCTRCGSAPIVARHERLEPILTKVFDSGASHLDLDALAGMIGGRTK